jgi:hypothetical protein
MDILDRIRRVETTPLHGTEAWVELWEVLQDARAEITSMLDAGDRLESQLCEAAKERDSLRLAIRRLAEQDATLSVCEGKVTVTMDATLTDAEREALEWLTAGESPFAEEESRLRVLRGLLERLG